MKNKIDLGNGHKARFFQWSPDRDLNPQYGEDMPDIPTAGVIIEHADGCMSSITFDSPEARKVFKTQTQFWTLHSLDPLHVEPSIMRNGLKNGSDHNHHGHIRGGRWTSCGDDLGPVTS